jgi:hypothetical protein
MGYGGKFSVIRRRSAPLPNWTVRRLPSSAPPGSFDYPEETAVWTPTIFDLEASGAQPGDEIVSINRRTVRDFSLAGIQHAQLVMPGDKKEIILRRGRQCILLKAVVARVL